MIFLRYGPGLRELLFTSHQYSDRTAREKELLNLDDKDYNYFSMMCSLFSNGVCGSVNTDPAIGFQHIMDLPSLDLEDIMTADYDNEDDKEELIENTKTLYNLIGLRIIADERAKHVLIESQLSIPTSIPTLIPKSMHTSIPKSMSTSMKTKLKKNKSKHKKKKNTLSTVYEEEEENPDSYSFLPPSKEGKTSTVVPTQRYTKKRGTTNRLLRQRLIEAIRNSRAQALQASTRKFNEEDEDSDTATVATAANSRKRSSTTNYETAKNISRNNNLSKKKRSSQMVTTGGRNKRGTKKYMKRKHKKTRNNKIKNKKYSTIKKIKRKNKKTRKNRHY